MIYVLLISALINIILSAVIFNLLTDASEAEENVKKIEAAVEGMKAKYESEIKVWRDTAKSANRMAKSLAFDFPVNVSYISRDDQIAISGFFAVGSGKALILHLQATLCNMAICAGENKQYAGQLAAEAHGYGECLKQLQSISVVPTESDIPAPSQEDEAGVLLNKFSP